MRVSVKYAKIQPAKLITLAIRGEEIIICRGSKLLVRLTSSPSGNHQKALIPLAPPIHPLLFPSRC
jgi:antitoxin (DNA-binding transcriptional repressor) of toxin-antitoxin stability system